MEEKFDIMLNNQAKMLEHLTLLTKDVNQLKIGQKRLEESQEDLKVRVTSLERGQQELKQGQKELIVRVISLERGQKFIRQDQKEMKTDLKWLRKAYIEANERLEYLEEKELQGI